MKPSNVLYTIATGSKRRQQLLAPIGLFIFLALLAGIVFGGLATDRAFAQPPLFRGSRGIGLGVLLIIPGAMLWGWCVVLFWRAHGTPVPSTHRRRSLPPGRIATFATLSSSACSYAFSAEDVFSIPLHSYSSGFPRSSSSMRSSSSTSRSQNSRVDSERATSRIVGASLRTFQGCRGNPVSSGTHAAA